MNAAGSFSLSRERDIQFNCANSVVSEYIISFLFCSPPPLSFHLPPLPPPTTHADWFTLKYTGHGLNLLICWVWSFLWETFIDRLLVQGLPLVSTCIFNLYSPTGTGIAWGHNLYSLIDSVITSICPLVQGAPVFTHWFSDRLYFQFVQGSPVFKFVPILSEKTQASNGIGNCAL